LKPLNSRHREIIGIILSLLAVLALISIYVDATGLVGLKLRSWLGVAFGRLAPLFAAVLLVLAVSMFLGKLRLAQVRRLLGCLLLLSGFVTLYHMTTVYHGYQLPPAMAEEIRIGQMGIGAGISGAFLMVCFLTAFGRVGSYVVLGGFGLIGLILVFDISLFSLIRQIWLFVFGLFRDGAGTVLDLVKGMVHSIQEARESRARMRLEAPSAGMAGKSTQAAKDREKRKKTKRQEKQSVEPGKQKKNLTGDEARQDSGGKGPTDLELDEVGPEADEFVPQPLPGRAYRLPPVYLLHKSTSTAKRSSSGHNRQLLEETFANFDIAAKVVNVCQGPVVTRYELQIGPGIKVSRITSLADDIALALAATGVRIEAPVPGKSVIGIEVPNRETQMVRLRELLEHPDYANHTSKVALALGKDIAGNPVIGDLCRWLHLLIAGATGSGKSVCLNTIIVSLLFRATPDEVKLMLIDPKRVELSAFDGIPHLIAPVVTDSKKAASALRWAVAEMERRYKMFADNHVKNIEAYYELLKNQQAKPAGDAEQDPEQLPYIVIIVDELADLMMVAAAEVEDAICRLAQTARAAGMYLIIATQRPSVDVITGLIKANVPSRISFAVSSQVDSRTVLDMGGAERLIGKGDMLYYPLGAAKPIRAQAAYVSDREVDAVVRFWKKQGEPDYVDVTVEKQSLAQNSQDTDELLEDAIRLVVETGQASISMLQRRFRIGYSRAARLIDMMEVRSIVGPYQGSKPREVLVDRDSLDL
jgi:S-DNA-T family DNA segregation ATPase FtsK/SpoIIIE